MMSEIDKVLSNLGKERFMKKRIIVDQPIIAQIQPLCSAFCQKVKDEKKRQSKTSQDIADWTGVPVSNINKFFSGNLSSPNLFYAAAICIYLGISLDEAFGLKQTSSETTERVKELEAQLHDCRNELEYCYKDRANLMESLKARKMIITVMFGVCVLLIASFSIGVIYDIFLPDKGFIQSGHIAWISAMIICVIVIAIAVTVSIMGHYLYHKEKDD